MVSSVQSELRVPASWSFSQRSETQAEELAWYCARTKPKHEHIAAANVHRNLGLEVFHPRLRVNRATRRGAARVIEPVFPCYIFVRCILTESLNEIRYATGVSTIVHFGHRTPAVSDSVIQELQECFGAEELMTADDALQPGVEVTVADGAFLGMRAFVLRVLPARQRVQILLDILGRPTPVEVDRNLVVVENGTMADRVPLLAVPHRESLRV
jgi:transcriptional antiterminator RfaH